MIEETTIGGREATVEYLDENFEPTSKGEEKMIKVVYEDGEVAFLKRV